MTTKKQMIIDIAKANIALGRKTRSADVAPLVGTTRNYVNLVRSQAGLCHVKIRKFKVVVHMSEANRDWLAGYAQENNITTNQALNSLITDARVEDEETPEEGKGGANRAAPSTHSEAQP